MLAESKRKVNAESIVHSFNSALVPRPLPLAAETINAQNAEASSHMHHGEVDASFHIVTSL